MSEPVRIGLIGLGRMGRFHAAAIADLDAVQVVALCDPVPSAVATAAAAYPGVATYADIEQALAHARLEAVLVATPTPTHPAVVDAALDHGVHVLCEKPLALHRDEGLRLGGRAAAAGLVLQVGFWRRFAGPWKAAHDARQRIGSPLMLRLCQWDADPPPPSFCNPEVSGGLAIDCGVHEFDLAEWLTGQRVTRVRAFAPPPVDAAIAATGDLENLVAVLELDGGAVATVDLSRNCRYADDVRTEVLGAHGALFVEMLPAGRARIGTAAGVEELAGSATPDATADGVRAQMVAFAAAVRGHPVEVPGAAASVRATDIGWAVRAATERNEVVMVP